MTKSVMWNFSVQIINQLTDFTSRISDTLLFQYHDRLVTIHTNSQILRCKYILSRSIRYDRSFSQTHTHAWLFIRVVYSNIITRLKSHGICVVNKFPLSSCWLACAHRRWNDEWWREQGVRDLLVDVSSGSTLGALSWRHLGRTTGAFVKLLKGIFWQPVKVDISFVLGTHLNGWATLR